MDKYCLKPCISTEEVQKQVTRLATRINQDYAGKDLVLVGILKGAVVFLSDLMRQLLIPVEVDFIRLSSYGKEAETSGKVQITKDIELPIHDRDVLIVEDIVDTGLTMKFLVGYLNSHHPKSLRVCVLIDKYERRKVDFTADYVALRLDEGFIVGYGLDFSEKHRNLPGIFEVHFENQ
jgi:hypoxanthine phosphoribosyltransferase